MLFEITKQTLNMKRMKMSLTSGAFITALVLSFAFKPASPKFATAYIKNVAQQCIVEVQCAGGSRTCNVSGKTAYTDKNSCLTTAFMP